MSPTVVAIDGPSASGKSTVARAVARALGYLYVDSGALYRGITWRALQSGLSAVDPAAVARRVARMRITARAENGAAVFEIDGLRPDPDDLRSAAVVEAVSDIAAEPAVRRIVGEQLNAAAGFGDLVVEGRDIGTVVFPQTPWKFFLDADPEERARRRSAESGVDSGRVGAQLRRRDLKDRSRSAAPLRRADDAVCIDTTRLNINQVVDLILRHVRKDTAAPQRR